MNLVFVLISFVTTQQLLIF